MINGVSMKQLEKFTNISTFNYANLLIITIILVLFPVLVLAHGGDDHDDQKAGIPIAQSGKLNSKLAKTSQTEILLKYPTPITGLETQLRVFITDLNTNSPIENAKVNLIFSLLNDMSNTSQQTSLGSVGVVYAANTDQLELDAVSSNIAGIYQVPVTFIKAGNYQLKLKITGSNIDASATISGIIVNEQIKQVAPNNRNMLWLLIITIALLLVVTLGWIWHRRTSLVKVRV
jgi:hypothetical protein